MNVSPGTALLGVIEREDAPRSIVLTEMGTELARLHAKSPANFGQSTAPISGQPPRL